MIRRLILTLIVLALAAFPIPALAWNGGHEVRGGHERFEHFHRPLVGVYAYPYPYYAYTSPACYWQDGYWGPNQPYIDQYGFERFQPMWVPGQWVCS